ncbi:MAG: hypothetical protein A2750_03135 [Candidatus Yanofskybacteria bacterium RIFCSPHIGHO2_01_FULL_45_42]|uniref:Probable DNA 3'-5' helicase RecG n=3 Tax=Candidatus Yanofskyibacteriota TaxID=1752733 RepID=A0A1F8F2D5_9BACT|nr:MAG: hypothetical protein A2750_03135 [Candidatus Yanofskybacteria bacterium RIFCSPHIGHO2_01_FULL_45_42]OGN16480.1 MAG: hypothetical protein A3C81_00585 [Candidatus Yanofskybacteria bacterium RIFCSPHIGHO2_02_FULL_46_19]OGN27380.1 MAG: hypothetical protein A3B17_00145 [Candidatus Yanofskybacteria bacterium RIFCSPLOWO2_01_FULL_45_72]OGN31710.1 MAG: hypothetical protein A3J01_02170 [Candidatus Yanofskybacteria bacterium RIFCSPLOWO2_02_FULL_45_18]
MELNLPIEKLPHVGPRNKSRLNRLGIKTVKDLLWHLPSRYEDYTEHLTIAEVETGQKVNIQGQVIKISTRRIFPRRLTVTTAIVGDESGAIKCVWFNQPYLENNLAEGTFVSLAGTAKLGKIGLHLASPIYEKTRSSDLQPVPIERSRIHDRVGTTYDPQPLKHTSGLVPIYPETEGVTSKYLRFLIKPLLQSIKLIDPLPEDMRARYGLAELNTALQTIHYPAKPGQAEVARKRLAFNDLLLLQLKSLLERRKMNQLKSISVPFQQEAVKQFINSLPFELTKDQKIAAWEILKDIQRSYPMNRLMEGDVGSGKTVVALIAAYQAALAGCQTVFLAPTEVLAQQHYQTITSLIPNFQSRKGDPRSPTGLFGFPISNQISNQKSQINIALLTASAAKLNGEEIKKPQLKKKIAAGEVNIIIGTHAILQKDVAFNKLALVVVDEQHRFGVNQRKALVRGQNADDTSTNAEKSQRESVQEMSVPHLLSMTATPIPRTLALTIYGDLDISIIKEKPKNRQKIITKVVAPKEVAKAYEFIRGEVNKGRQIFVVCPRIENANNQQPTANNNQKLSVVSRKSPVKQLKMDALWAEVKAVEEEYKKLSKEIFPDLRVAMLHGRMKAKEKNQIMSSFANASKDEADYIDILVSTSVIEVGVDVPNASVMVIESAERFGLAQLHQFRGRVGRDKYQSHCLLFASDGQHSRRLEALAECDDGFELAEKDMLFRGPGEFFGVKQSGLPDLAMASLADVDLIKKARLEARLLLKENPSLSKYPLLKDELAQMQKITHFE